MVRSHVMAAKKTAKKAKSSPTPRKAEAPKAAPPPKKGRGGPRGPRAGSKTSFIMSQPLELVARDVVAAGAKAGLEFSDKFVWSVRSSAKRTAPKGAAASKGSPTETVTPKKGPGRPKTARVSSNTRSASGSLEEQLFSLALEVGIARAEEIVQRARTQIGTLRL